MNPFFARFLSSVYRKEPISGFLLIIGVTDALIGGIGGRLNLFSVGLTVALLGMAMRYIQTKKVRAIKSKRRVRYSRYQLPPGTANSPLPLLVSKKRRR